MWLGSDRYFEEFEAETARLAGLVHDTDVQQPVPTCPDWTLEQLIGHVGRGHRWSADIVRRRLLEPIPLQKVVVPAGADERHTDHHRDPLLAGSGLWKLRWRAGRR
jgi:hypothetical protein